MANLKIRVFLKEMIFQFQYLPMVHNLGVIGGKRKGKIWWTMIA